MVIDNVLDIRKYTKQELIQFLEEKEFKKESNTYNYLIGMPLYQMTKDLVDQLNETFENKQEEYKMIEEKSIEKMWLKDLKDLDKYINKQLLESISIDDTIIKTKTTKKNKK